MGVGDWVLGVGCWVFEFQEKSLTSEEPSLSGEGRNLRLRESATESQKRKVARAVKAHSTMYSHSCLLRVKN